MLLLWTEWGNPSGGHWSKMVIVVIIGSSMSISSMSSSIRCIPSPSSDIPSISSSIPSITPSISPSGLSAGRSQVNGQSSE